MSEHVKRTINLKQPEEALFTDARKLCCELVQGWQHLSPADIKVKAGSGLEPVPASRFPRCSRSLLCNRLLWLQAALLTLCSSFNQKPTTALNPYSCACLVTRQSWSLTEKQKHVYQSSCIPMDLVQRSASQIFAMLAMITSPDSTALECVYRFSVPLRTEEWNLGSI